MKTIITLLCTASIAWAVEMASGTVFNDANGNGQRDPDEKGLAGVGVSNGEAIVETDADGRWQLRLWWKPFVTLIWYGGLLIALGGVLALVGRVLSDLRHRRLAARIADRRADREALA